MQSLFITGTDTGVGKTLVTALLALRLRAQGIDAGVMKPMASGCECIDGVLTSEDAVFLRDATGVEDELDLICPVLWEEPLAPLTAARRARQPFYDAMPRVHKALRELQHRHEVVLVEGVGGLLVPLQQSEDGEFYTCADFANELGFPVVIVARRTLGTMNHTLLTTSFQLQNPARFEGMVFCDAAVVDEKDIAAQTSPQIISEVNGLPIWGQVPYLTDLSRVNLQCAANEYLNI